MKTDLILGISAYYHDSAACLIRDGEIVSAAQEERFTRKKHTANFPSEAIQFCLTDARVTWDDLRYIVFYDKPLIKFERLLETYLNFCSSRNYLFLDCHAGLAKRKTVSQKLASKGMRADGGSSKHRRTASYLVWRTS